MAERQFDTIYKHVLLKLRDLDPELTYHCIEHTLDVVEHTARLGMDESINAKELFLLKVAALYHDTGFLHTYKDHEIKSCEIFLEDSKQFQFKDGEIKIILDLIMATRVPQIPKTLLQKIICDADLDYLGRHDFDEVAARLKTEFLNYSIVASDNEWQQMQLKFLENHAYHTNSSQLIREPIKKVNIKKIK